MLFFVGVAVAVAFGVVFARPIVDISLACVVTVARWLPRLVGLALAGVLIAIGWEEGWVEVIGLIAFVAVIVAPLVFASQPLARAAAREQDDCWRLARRRGLSVGAGVLAIAAGLFLTFRVARYISLPVACFVLLSIADARATGRDVGDSDLWLGVTMGAGLAGLFYVWRRFESESKRLRREEAETRKTPSP